jgi:Kef-type K+ transport system membrane component KefB/nucleotide-binding universal stress UspA family protein
MVLLNIIDITLPLTNPVLKFLVILLIILIAPILSSRIKIPHILGLIISGAVIGPYGMNLILRDSGIILSGTAGLLYIMFLAALEIDLSEFRKNSSRSVVFGLMTFLIPMVLGTLAGLYVLNFTVPTSVLLASLFASHTLITYPIVSGFGVTKNRAVNIAIGGTMITDTLALLVLAVIVGTATGEVDTGFWINLTISVIVSGLIIIFIFPRIARWFFKNYNDNVSQYIFVLVLVFLGAFLAEIAGIEGIIGAFFTGLALNRLIPVTSPLKNRIEFVGNAIFIPFFLISVGMLIDYRAFFRDPDTITVAAVMTIIATSAKYIAAWATQKSFGFTIDERRLIFGLSNAQAAATLAAVIVGYNVIIGEQADGYPVRLLNESVLNGAIIMILITCTIASFFTQKGAQNISLSQTAFLDESKSESVEKILIAVSNPETVEELISLSSIIKSAGNKYEIYALNVIINRSSDPEENQKAKKLLEKAAVEAASTDIHLNKLLRYDLNIVNAITGVIREHNITDLILGVHGKKGITKSFLGNLTEGILTRCNTTTFVYKSTQPISTIKRHIIVVPVNAEHEIGFPFWLIKIWNIGRNTRGKLRFYGAEKTLNFIREIHAKHPIEADFRNFSNWNDFLILSRDIEPDDNLLIIMSRENKPSYHHNMVNIPVYLNSYFRENSFLIVYPMQRGVTDNENVDLKNASLLESIETLDEIGKTLAGLFKRR